MPKYRGNRYRDLEIDISRLVFSNADEFIAVIRAEYDKWARKLQYSRERFTAVMWLNVPKSHARVVPWLLEDEPRFSVHHANASRFMMVAPHYASNGRAQIPSYGTHYVKVECVVIEDGTGKILMVRERIGTDSALKIVSGSAEAGEFFADAAMREVSEETGIVSRFGSLIGCGNRLKTRFDRDEIIMGCLLFAQGGQVPRPDGSEVSEAAWFDPRDIITICTPMAREWIAAANACNVEYQRRCHTFDLFRGKTHLMDFFVPVSVNVPRAPDV